MKLHTIIIHILGWALTVSGLIWLGFEVLFYITDKDPINYGSVMLMGSGIIIEIVNAIVAFSKVKSKFPF